MYITTLLRILYTTTMYGHIPVYRKLCTFYNYLILHGMHAYVNALLYGKLRLSRVNLARAHVTIG